MHTVNGDREYKQVLPGLYLLAFRSNTLSGRLHIASMYVLVFRSNTLHARLHNTFSPLSLHAHSSFVATVDFKF